MPTCAATYVPLLSRSIAEGLVSGISNGSFKDGHGTAAWTLKTPSGLEYTRSGIVPGPSSDQSAYRSELFGIYKLVQILAATCKEYGVKSGRTVIACNGESALYCAFGDTQTPSPKNKLF